MLTACASSSKITRLAGEDHLSSAERRKFNYYFLEANRMKHQGKNDAAFDLLRKAVSVDTASAPVRYELANYYLRLGRPNLALEYLQGASRVDPDNYWYGMMEAHLLHNLNMSEKAIDVYQNLSLHYPEKPEIHYSMADVYTQLNRPVEAIGALNKLEENMGVMEPITLEKHRLYMLLNEPDNAFAEIRKLIAAYPNNFQYQILLGDLYLNAGMLPEARVAYDQAAEVKPDNVYLLVSRANYYNSIGDIAASNELVRNALVNEKLDVETKIEILTGYLTTILQKKESVADADSLFTTILDQHPQVSEVHGLYAEFLLAVERFDEAREQLGYAVDLNPNEKRLWMQLLGVAMKKENWKDVVDVTRSALLYFPDQPEFYLYKGVGHSMAEEPQQALEPYLEALQRIDQRNVQMISDLWGQVGDVYHKMNDNVKAYEAYDEALKYNEKNIGVLNNYSYFLSLDKSDLSKAERMSGMAVKLEPNNSTYLDTYAWVYFQQGNYMLARFYIQSAINNGGDKSPEILEHYGDILFMDGQVEEALKQWEKALELGSESKMLPRKIETKTYIAE